MPKSRSCCSCGSACRSRCCTWLSVNNDDILCVCIKHVLAFSLPDPLLAKWRTTFESPSYIFIYVVAKYVCVEVVWMGINSMVEGGVISSWVQQEGEKTCNLVKLQWFGLKYVCSVSAGAQLLFQSDGSSAGHGVRMEFLPRELWGWWGNSEPKLGCAAVKLGSQIGKRLGRRLQRSGV